MWISPLSSLSLASRLLHFAPLLSSLAGLPSLAVPELSDASSYLQARAAPG